MTIKLHIDFETRSAVDLRRVGTPAYAAHPSTKILCMAWKFTDDTNPNSGASPLLREGVWTPGKPFPHMLLTHVQGGGMVMAHNSNFERNIWNTTLDKFFNISILPKLRAKQLDQDTMIRCLYWGLPASLDEAARALGLTLVKDPAHVKNMRAMTKDAAGLNDTHSGLAMLEAYCMNDVEMEILLDAHLPPLPDRECELWRLDQSINDRGLLIDKDRIDTLIGWAASETRRLTNEMITVTHGMVSSVTAPMQIIKHLEMCGYYLSSLDKATLTDTLKRVNLPPDCRRVLEIRQEAAKTSVAKLSAMLNHASDDLRIRNTLQFGGAGRTMRFAGRGPQIQNFPRPHLKRAKLEEEFIFGKPSLQLVSSLLRSCFIAEPGKAFVVIDLAQIEFRLSCWATGQDDVLAVFRAGGDVYTFAANKQGSTDRTFGKVLSLSLSYGMGWAMLIEAAKLYGLELSQDAAKIAVTRWRLDNFHIRDAWYEIQSAAEFAINAKDNTWRPISIPGVSIGCFFEKRSKTWCLMIKLPSGHVLTYRDPKFDPSFGGEGITYMGLNSYTHKWERIRTWGGSLFNNIIQAMARDIICEVLRFAENLGGNPIASIHDEIICEVPLKGMAQVVFDRITDYIKNHLAGTLYAGCPLDSDGYIETRYGK